jgi:hypothetical protein
MEDRHTKEFLWVKEKFMKNNGAYDLEGVIWHQHSNLLMNKILELWPDKAIPVVDLGCGMNYYSNVLSYAGYKSVGVDGTTLNGYRTDIIESDLTEKYIDEIYDEHSGSGLKKITLKDYLCQRVHGFTYEKPGNVISLEVGEHIPSEKADAYLDNLTSFGGYIIMSWAVPGQAGHNHINCQTNDWVEEQMDKRGYRLDLEVTEEIRQSVSNCHCTWFKNTLMYFCPKSTFSMI